MVCLSAQPEVSVCLIEDVVCLSECLSVSLFITQLGNSCARFEVAVRPHLKEPCTYHDHDGDEKERALCRWCWRRASREWNEITRRTVE